MLTNNNGFPSIEQSNISILPLSSDITFDILAFEFNLAGINIATPLLLVDPCEKIIFPPQSFPHFTSSSTQECVSCKNVIPSYFDNQLKIAFLFLTSPNPRQLKELRLILFCDP